MAMASGLRERHDRRVDQRHFGAVVVDQAQQEEAGDQGRVGFHLNQCSSGGSFSGASGELLGGVEAAAMDRPDLAADALGGIGRIERLVQMVVQPDEIEGSADPGDAHDHVGPAQQQIQPFDDESSVHASLVAPCRAGPQGGKSPPATVIRTISRGNAYGGFGPSGGRFDRRRDQARLRKGAHQGGSRLRRRPAAQVQSPAARSCWRPASSARSGSMPARSRISCRRPRRSVRATGRWRRCRRTFWTAASRSPDRSIAR